MSSWIYIGGWFALGYAVTWIVCRMLERPPGRHVMDERVWYLADAVVKKPPPPLAELYPGDDLMGVADAVTEEPYGDCRCGDMHNTHCEPPSELCCWHCTEAGHDSFPVPHADGSACVLDLPLPPLESDPVAIRLGIVPAPEPTLREESIQPPYGSRRLVRVGNALVHAGCRDARRDAASDWVCERCGRAFGSVTTV